MTTLLCLWMVAGVGAREADVQSKAHQRVRALMAIEDGRVVFSDLHNDAAIPPAEKEYLGRLYEIFFALPAYLRSEYQATGVIPSVKDLAGNFGVTQEAVDLLLDIMTSEPRMPMLLARNESTGEIEVLDVDAVDDFVRQRGSAVKVSGWVGRSAPSFELPALDGGTLGDTDLRGKSAILFIWLTRCPACRRIMPHMVELEKKFRGRGLKIVGLNADQALGLDVPEKERKDFVRESGIQFPVAMLDRSTRAALGNGNIFPMLFFVRADGTISRLVLNYQDQETLEEWVEMLLEGSGM